jgi:hypothetical protein
MLLRRFDVAVVYSQANRLMAPGRRYQKLLVQSTITYRPASASAPGLILYSSTGSKLLSKSLRQTWHNNSGGFELSVKMIPATIV